MYFTGYKINNFCLSKDAIKRVKWQGIEGRRYLQYKKKTDKD